MVPTRETVRALNRAAVADPAAPSTEEIAKLGGLLKADAIVTGVVREYGEIRSSSAGANAISVSAQMYETQTGRLIWSASSTLGGVSAGDRLLGGKGVPMNEVTENAVRDLCPSPDYRQDYDVPQRMDGP